MSLAGRILLEIAAVLITLGGLYDLLRPNLPPNLAAICAGNDQAYLARELLRALGGALISIGVTIIVLLVTSSNPVPPRILATIVLLVVPAEGVNAVCMRRVGSPFQVPVAFLLLTLLGTGLLAVQSH